MANRRGRRGRLTSQLGGGFVVPTLALSATSASLASTAGSTEAVQSVITATSGNGGTLGGVGIGTITESVGSGWLSASVQGGFPALVTIVCDPTGLSAGTYTGSVQVTDPKASNSPRSVSVQFVVAAVAAPAIALSNPSVTLSVQQGNAATDSAVCTATSSTATGLGTLSLGSITGTGSTGVSASVSGNVVTITGSSAALTSASSPYTATIPVIDATASNSPQNITVTLNVAPVSPPAFPEMALSSPSVGWVAVEGSNAVRTTTVTVTSTNGAALGTTSVGTITGTGSGYITTSVTGNVVTVTYTLGAAPAGSYTASVPILDSLADNSPQTFTVTVTVVASSAPTAVIPAAIHQFGSPSGTVLVAGGWPLPPGYLTAADVTARKFAIFVSGVEQSCYVQAMPGLHADGTSLRAVMYQFNYDVPNSTPIAAEVRLGTARTTTDLPKTTLTPDKLYVPQTPQVWGTDAEPTAKLVPNDIAYNCITDVTFEPLQPAALDDPVSAARFTTFFGQRLNALKVMTDKTLTSVRTYKSTYESGRALIAAWCRTGTVDYLREALKQGYRLLEYDCVTPTSPKPNPSNNVFAEPRMASSDGNIAEQYFLRYMSYAACWQMSAYAPFFAAVNTAHMNNNYSGRATAAGANLVNNSATGGYINSVYLPRFNMVRWAPHLIAYTIGATRRQSTQSGFGNRDMNFSVELPLILGALDNVAYTLGDYRDGLRALSQTSTDGAANGGVGAGAVPNFQINYVNAFLMLYEREVYADPRIPGWIKTNTDVMLANTELLVPSSRGYGYTDSGYGTTYFANPTAAQGSAQSDYLGYMAGSLAYCAAKYPNTVSNGATYETWYQRAADYKNVGYTSGTLKSDWDQFFTGWKIFGEAFGFQMAAPYYIAQGVPAGAPAIHSVPVLTNWPT